MLRSFGIIGPKLTTGTGGQVGFGTPQKIWARVLVCLIISHSKSKYVTAYTISELGISRKEIIYPIPNDVTMIKIEIYSSMKSHFHCISYLCTCRESI